MCERYRVERLALFGSALLDDFDSGHSDLDFSEGFQPMTPQEHVEFYFSPLGDHVDLFARRVDLVEIAAACNPCLKREIEERGVGI